MCLCNMLMKEERLHYLLQVWELSEAIDYLVKANLSIGIDFLMEDGYVLRKMLMYLEEIL